MGALVVDMTESSCASGSDRFFLAGNDGGDTTP